MKRALPAVGLVLIVLVVLVTILQETHVIGGTSNPQSASVTQVQTQSLPETSAQQVDPSFCSNHKTVPTADTQLPYTDTAHGLSMQLPYSAGWTDVNGGKLSPYVQLQNGISFGPIVYLSLDQGQSCSAVRAYTLAYGSVRSAADTKDVMEATYGRTGNSVTVTTVGSLPAVQWTMNSMVCSVPMLEVTGRTSNYILSMSCGVLGTNNTDNFQTLKKIAGTITAQ